ncbi:MAG: S8 family peptidase, partial [Caldilineaceae bacterium]|nr:S8 family peptidase [Caldilineaceae bacterium]
MPKTSMPKTSMPKTSIYGTGDRRFGVDDPFANQERESLVSVIVTGETTAAAAAAVHAIQGEVQSELWLIHAVSAIIAQDSLTQLAMAPGVTSIVRDHAVQRASYVSPTPNPLVWEVQSPVSVEVGATELHGISRTTEQPITGKGVTVAVVDTGVAFNPMVTAVLSDGIRDQFMGEADFVGSRSCSQGAVRKERNQVSYCWRASTGYDPYGHGSHVAGIIWNQFIIAGHDDDWGVAPEANILSIRVLGADGTGTYTDVIEGIQFAVQQREEYNIRVMNLSLLAYATTPYFVDPVNRAVEAAWQKGIVVVAAAGNNGPAAESITVPGNDPYVITVGAYDTSTTMNNWADDNVSLWSSTGPTKDGFIKPDVLAPGANVVSYMYTDPSDRSASATLVRLHPDYNPNLSLYRLNGTSMATGVVSGVVALMVQAHPQLGPDQIKFRLMYTARSAVNSDGQLLYNLFQQGSGRVWAPDAVLSNDVPDERANAALQLENDLSHLWLPAEQNGALDQGDLDQDGVGNESPVCLGKEILFIGSRRPLVSRDQVLVDRLKALGFHVVIRNQYESRTNDAEGKALIIISDSIWSPWINTKYTDVAVP